MKAFWPLMADRCTCDESPDPPPHRAGLTPVSEPGDPASRPQFAIAAGLLLVAVATGVAVITGVTAAIDRALLLDAAVAPGSGLATLMESLTWLGDFGPRIVIAFAVAIFIGLRGRWRDGLQLIGLLAVGMAIVALTKMIVARPRPDLLPHLDVVTSASFPSAHAANNMMLWLGIALLFRARPFILAALIAIPLAIGLSRIALGVHWPTDVIAGWSFGAAWALLVVGLCRAPR